MFFISILVILFCVHSHLWFTCIWVMLRADKRPCSNENLWQMAAGLTAQTLWGLNLSECLLGGLEGRKKTVLWNIAQAVFRSINFTRFKVSGVTFYLLILLDLQFLFPSRMLILINGWNFCRDIYSLLHRGPNIDMLRLTWESVTYVVAYSVEMMMEMIIFVQSLYVVCLFLDLTYLTIKTSHCLCFVCDIWDVCGLFWVMFASMSRALP